MNLDTWVMDLRLGLRLLAKHPVLTVIGVLATSLAIAGAAAYFEISNDFGNPTLPLAEGDRVVTIQNQDLEAAAAERRALHDFTVWRAGLKSVTDLGAYAIYARNLAPRGGTAQPADVVEISASAFRVARIAPLVGRSLADADEQPGSPPVAVIGEHLWETRFNRDPGIVGQTVELGSVTRTIVGVMPAAFALPLNHTLWVPFQMNALDYARRQGPAIGTIGRLAPGVSLEQAQAELSVIGERLAAEFPESNARLRPRVMPYLEPFAWDPSELLLRRGLNTIFLLLLVLICANVGALVFARIATRENELTVRTALGASRRRIVLQMFVESLVLTSVGAVLALGALAWALGRARSFVWEAEGAVPPFWWNGNVNASTVLYVAGLALAGAFVTGVLPALRFTRGGVEINLRRGAMGASGLKSRRMSTAVIVAQVALSGALLPLALGMTLQMNWLDFSIADIRGDEFLTLRYRTEQSAAVPADDDRDRMAAHFTATWQALKARLLNQGGIAEATFTNHLPGSTHLGRLIEVEDSPDIALQRVRVATVDAGFFDALGAPILVGRGFHAGDLAADRAVVIVNQPFVEAVLGGRSAVGRRVRYAGAEGDATSRSGGRYDPGRVYEIVGVVGDLGMSPVERAEAKGMYHPVPPAELPAGYMAVRVGPNAGASARKIREMAAAVDPTLLVDEVRPLNEIGEAEVRSNRLFGVGVAATIYFIVLLSASVTFALMSFIVSQRTREIGIRKALGAGPRAVLSSVFSRALLQLGLGAVLGAGLSLFALSSVPDTYIATPGMSAAVMAFLLLVGLLSCGAPAARAVRIEPTQAIREE